MGGPTHPEPPQTRRGRRCCRRSRCRCLFPSGICRFSPRCQCSQCRQCPFFPVFSSVFSSSFFGRVPRSASRPSRVGSSLSPFHTGPKVSLAVAAFCFSVLAGLLGSAPRAAPSPVFPIARGGSCVLASGSGAPRLCACPIRHILLHSRHYKTWPRGEFLRRFRAAERSRKINTLPPTLEDF